MLGTASVIYRGLKQVCDICGSPAVACGKEETFYSLQDPFLYELMKEKKTQRGIDGLYLCKNHWNKSSVDILEDYNREKEMIRYTNRLDLLEDE